MATPSLSDLRYLYYGGGSAAEYQFLLAAQAAGITASSFLKPLGVGSYSAAGDDAINTKVTGDNNPRFSIDADGTHSWGSGSAAVDTLLSRTTINQLSLTGASSRRLDVVVGSSRTILTRFGLCATAAHDFTTSSGSDSVPVVRSRAELTGQIPLVAQGAASQTGDLFQAQNSSAAVLVGVGATGKLQLNSGTAAGAGNNTGAGIYSGTGAPNNANGTNGDIYIRTDGAALSTIYQRRAGVWTGII